MTSPRPAARHLANQFLHRPLSQSGLFSPDECRRILALRSDEGSLARIQGDGQLELDREIRRTTRYPIRDTPENRWIIERIAPAVIQLNQATWRFKIGTLSAIDLLEYGPGDFYGWHIDIGAGNYSWRKLSCVVLLSDRADYGGGRLVFAPGDVSLGDEQGTLVLFPSYMLHQVEPVTSGLRHSLVFWAEGDAFA